jgi:prolyl-tRNA synthetase
MGAVAETVSDDAGLNWPIEIAPFQIHLLSLARTEDEKSRAEGIYQLLIDQGLEVLFDDRMDIRAGEKFVEADLLGLPLRLIVSQKTLAQQSVEYKFRKTGETGIVRIDEVVKFSLAAGR